MIEHILMAFMWVLIPATLIATLVQSVPWTDRMKKNLLMFCFIHPGWLFPVIFLSAIHIGGYARTEISPIPWRSFSHELMLHDFGSACFSFATVSTVSLWCFWTGANAWFLHHPQMDKTKRVMAHVINLLFGLIVTQPDNPIYRIL